MVESFILRKEQVEGPIVYIFWLGNQCQYVGSSEMGLQRPTGRHEFKLRAEYDRIEVKPQESIQAALSLEAQLIQELCPIYNVMGVVKYNTIKKPRKLRTIEKVKDEASGAFLVIEGRHVLFSSFERYERNRFFAQECQRRCNQMMKEAGDKAKIAAREREQQ